jgi:DNA-binding MarR family transcriptional regulator
LEELFLSVISSLRELGAEQDRLDDVASRFYGLNRTDMRALEIVSRSGPVAPTDLARLMGFTTGGITTVVDRLERAGYVARRREEADRRRLVVISTDATANKDQQAFGVLMESVAGFMGTFRPEELVAIARFLEGVRMITASAAESLDEAMYGELLPAKPSNGT